MADEGCHHDYFWTSPKVVEANGYSILDLSQEGSGFKLELNSHLDDEAISYLCGQFPLSADYSGEGNHGTIISLYA